MSVFVWVLLWGMSVHSMDNQAPPVLTMGSPGPSPEAYAIRRCELQKIALRCTCGFAAFGSAVPPVLLFNWASVTTNVVGNSLLAIWGFSSFLTATIICTGALDRCCNVCCKEWHNLDRLHANLERMEWLERNFLVEKIFIPCDRGINGE